MFFGVISDVRYSSSCKTILIPQVAELLMKNKGLSEDEALKTIYESPVAKLLEDDSMGLYGQSALYLYGLIVEE